MWSRSTMSHHNNDTARAIIESKHHQVFEYAPDVDHKYHCSHCGESTYGNVYVIVCTGTRWSEVWTWTHVVCRDCRDSIQETIMRRIERSQNVPKAVKDFQKSMKNLKASLVKAQKMGML